jgi:hypothetical protein
MRKYGFYLSVIIGLFVLVLGACKKDPVQTPAEFVQDKPHDPNMVGYWIGFADAKIEVVSGVIKVTLTDTSTIFPAVSEFQSGGADFSYVLKKENGNYIHSYDPNSKNSENYWYSGVSGKEKVVYDVYALGGGEPSSYLEFDYIVYNTDTLITTDYTHGETRVLVRLADPSKIPSTLKIKQ